MDLSPAKLGRRLDNARSWLRRDSAFISSEKTPFEVIADDGLATLRYYPPLEARHIRLDNQQLGVSDTVRRTPLVIVSPLAVNMGIYDLFPERSFVRYMLAQGFPVYLVNWGSPERRHDSLTLANYFADRLPVFLDQVRSHSQQQDLSLHGWSFGGLFSYAYTALSRDAHIRNLVLVGAPCDYHANGMLGKHYRRLARSIRWVNKRTSFRIHKTRPGIWRASGIGNAVAFKLTSPVGSLRNYLKLVRHLHDDNFVVKHATNAAFLDQMEAYTGASMQDIIQYLITDNLLARGRLPMANRPALLADINANILMITGKQDVIVTSACSHALLKQVKSDDVSALEIAGGHMNIVGSSTAARDSWPNIAQWLIERDGTETGVTPLPHDEATASPEAAPSTASEVAVDSHETAATAS